MTFNPNKIVYWKNGVPYRKLRRDETIQEGDMQSWCYGELQTITNSDGKTVGDTPSSFSDERDFYHSIDPQNYGWYTFNNELNKPYYIPEALRASIYSFPFILFTDILFCKEFKEGFFMLYDTEDIYLVTGYAKDVMPMMLTFKKWNGAPVNKNKLPVALLIPEKYLDK